MRNGTSFLLHFNPSYLNLCNHSHNHRRERERKRMASPKSQKSVLIICGDYMEDYEVMNHCYFLLLLFIYWLIPFTYPFVSSSIIFNTRCVWIFSDYGSLSSIASLRILSGCSVPWEESGWYLPYSCSSGLRPSGACSTLLSLDLCFFFFFFYCFRTWVLLYVCSNDCSNSWFGSDVLNLL